MCCSAMWYCSPALSSTGSSNRHSVTSPVAMRSTSTSLSASLLPNVSNPVVIMMRALCLSDVPYRPNPQM